MYKHRLHLTKNVGKGLANN